METLSISPKRGRGRPQGAYSYGEPISVKGVSLFDRHWTELRRIANEQHLPLALVLRQIIDEWLVREGEV